MAWADVGQQRDSGGSSSHLLKLEGQNRIRLLLTGGKIEGEPDTYWTYAMSAPDGGYRTWLSPDRDSDFFRTNSSAFRPRVIHVGVVYDYTTNSVKVLEAGNQIWEEIKKFMDAGINILNCDLMIKKTGTGRSTEYSVIYYQESPAPTVTEGYNLQELYGNAPTYEEVLDDLRTMGFTNPEELFTPKPLSYDVAKDTVVPFGKHKDKTLLDVFNSDTRYIDFLATKIDREDIKQSARVVSNQLMQTSYEVEGVCPTADEVGFQSPEQGGSAPVQQTPPVPQTTAPAPQAPPVPAQPQVYVDEATGTTYHLINNEWIMQPQTPPVPQAPPTPAPQVTPVTQATPAPVTPAPVTPAPVTPAPAPVTPAPVTPAPAPAPAPTGGDREQLIEQINKTFEEKPEYKDFTLIIAKLREATNPNPKTSINEFTEEELQKLLSII